MGQRNRYDEPASIHHVGNRAIAKRTAFEGRRDTRKFLAELVRASRAGWIEILAFCVMATHFHLLLRSPGGEMWRGLRRAQNVYVRWFNRRRRRDGPLFRGRFWSRRVWSMRYLQLLVRYVDHNPVKAGMVEHAADYPFGSATCYLSQDPGPRWLERSEIDELAAHVAGDQLPPQQRYASAFGAPLTRAEEELLERRMAVGRTGPDPLDDLVGAAPSTVQAWMVAKARLADGTRPGYTLVAPQSLLALVAEDGVETRAEAPRDATLIAGLLSTLCAASAREIAQVCGVSCGTASRRAHGHRMRLITDTSYAARAAELATAAIAAQWK